MEDERLDKIVDDLYLFFPLFRKKIFKHKRRLHQGKIPHSYYHVLKILDKHGDLPMSEIGRKVHISKSNMTSLIDKLVENGLTERLPDQNDRRVINISITNKGKDILRDWRKYSNNEIKKSLSVLSEEDLEKFYESVENIKDILYKLGND
ncbi:MarR family winged helix-turn-helix transcriptional regulator [Methanobacterium sp.]|uniref:MarR family winged helix-turn-helix transcriptional regulator n=1 Tax=Methanobacterium sp. TaxID=2164 RepID=UPI0025EB1AC9|nr:MarR family transcriptional regulator [Methanobacterium sp.]MBI5460228.1 MarR family transcriptional regulator [Methanobacterium sp.]MDY9923673.1 MarR family transcriptional regulator [Methanobacterium sp.]